MAKENPYKIIVTSHSSISEANSNNNAVVLSQQSISALRNVETKLNLIEQKLKELFQPISNNFNEQMSQLQTESKLLDIWVKYDALAEMLKQEYNYLVDPNESNLRSYNESYNYFMNITGFIAEEANN